MFVLAALGLFLAHRENRSWRLIWISALIISIVCGALEMIAGHRIARQHSKNETRPGLPARVAGKPEILGNIAWGEPQSGDRQ